MMLYTNRNKFLSLGLSSIIPKVAGRQAVIISIIQITSEDTLHIARIFFKKINKQQTVTE